MDIIEKFENLVTLGRQKGAFSRMLTVTPELAEHILDANPANRSLSHPEIRRLSREIMDGKWVENGETIIISKEGLLNDGQHRLHAVVHAGKPIRSLVAFGIEREARNTVDVGIKRQSGHFLSMNGIQNGNMIAAAVSLLLSTERGLSWTNASQISSKEHMAILEYAQANQDDLVDASNMARRIYKKIKTSTSALTTAFYLMLQGEHRDFVEDFVSALETGLGMEPRSPVYLLREKLISLSGSSASNRSKVVAYYVIRSWNAYVEGEKLRRLQAPKSDILPDAL